MSDKRKMLYDDLKNEHAFPQITAKQVGVFMLSAALLAAVIVALTTFP